jgi:hypothetical protein
LTLVEAQAALTVRLKDSIDALRDETALSGRRLSIATWVLVALTVAIAAMTVVLVVKS